MIHALVVVYRLLTFFAISSVADRDILEIYRQFLIDHNHDGTRIHDPARLVAFSESLNYIKNHPGTSYGVKLNEMADWLPHEFNARFVSVQTNEEQPRQVNRPPLLRTGNDFMIHTEGQSSSDPIAIDWATSLNPTGKGTISIVRNQGLCGACWAFVAAASVESLARIGGGKQISLSVQELVDCDNSYNKGCEGGNPLYAYEYVKLNALTSWEDYPYKELESTCHRRKYRPIAAVEDYKKLPENDQMVLKHYVGQGPVAVGLCATDKSFMFYAHGVYNAADCCTAQNHAVLIVGYGHDEATNLDYWIALNSWGQMWGERGYVRLLRTNDTSSSGTCGLAVNPVAPRGGYVLDVQDLEPSSPPSTSTDDPGQGGDHVNVPGSGGKGKGGGGDRKPGAHSLPLGSELFSFLRDHWEQLSLGIAGSLMAVSFVVLAYVSYLDYVGAANSGPLVNINTGTGPGLGLGSETATGSSLYERIYLLCTLPTNYSSSNSSGSSNEQSQSQSQSSRYNELGVETETDIDGDVPSSSSSSSSSINGRRPRPGPLEMGGVDDDLDPPSSPSDGIVSAVCSEIYGWTVAAATQGVTPEDLDLRLRRARALVEDAWVFLRQTVREGWLWVFHACLELHVWVNQGFDAMHQYVTTWMADLRRNNEIYANAEIVLGELATNAQENLRQLAVDLRECMGGQRHDTSDEGVDSSSSNHEINAQRRGEGGTTISYHSNTTSAELSSSSAEGTGGSSTDAASFRRQ